MQCDKVLLGLVSITHYPGPSWHPVFPLGAGLRFPWSLSRGGARHAVPKGVRCVYVVIVVFAMQGSFLLAAAEPALGLGRLGLDLAVELVHLLERAGLNVLGVRLGVGAGLGQLRLRLAELCMGVTRKTSVR